MTDAPRTSPPPPPPPPRPVALAPGDVYEGFTLVEAIGSGSFAWVFSATHPDYERAVALKISKDPVTSEETALRALREIRILGSLANPHVVHVYDHGLGSDERWYMVLELLEGEALSTRHDFSAALPPAEAVRIVHQACLGLDEAHRGGVVHRDVKPDNVWLLPDGTVKILDFGLARAWDNDTTIGANATSGHMLIGTPHYAQPEQVQTGRLTPASDVYSLGILLYELLCGRMPLFPDEPCNAVRERLRDDPLAWLVAHAKRPVLRIERYAEGAALPVALVDIVHRALAKDPSERFETAGALANALASVLHGELGTTPAATLHVTFPSGARRSHVVLPGVHRVGHGPQCDISIADNDDDDLVFAIIEWSGVPREAALHPLIQDGSLRVNGHVLDYRVRLVPGTKLQMGLFRVELSYPASMDAVPAQDLG
jgi:serine/threonine-protein kinase